MQPRKVHVPQFVLIPLLLAACTTEGGPVTVPGNEEEAAAILQEEVATIALDDGDIRFSVDMEGEEAGSVTVLERIRPDKDGTMRIHASEGSALEIFLDHTSEDTPVPTALVAEESDETLLARASQREEVDFLSQTVDSILEQPPAIARATNAQMCAEGTTSGSFWSQVCSLDDHWTKNFCHNGTWHSVTDESGSSHKSEWIRGRTLACGANGRVRLYYKGLGWRKHLDTSVPSGTSITATRKASTKRQRKATHSRTASGFVRATTDFYRFPF